MIYVILYSCLLHMSLGFIHGKWGNHGWTKGQSLDILKYFSLILYVHHREISIDLNKDLLYIINNYQFIEIEPSPLPMVS